MHDADGYRPEPSAATSRGSNPPLDPGQAFRFGTGKGECGQVSGSPAARSQAHENALADEGQNDAHVEHAAMIRGHGRDQPGLGFPP